MIWSASTTSADAAELLGLRRGAGAGHDNFTQSERVRRQREVVCDVARREDDLRRVGIETR
jgi:hypothetical protein